MLKKNVYPCVDNKIFDLMCVKERVSGLGVVYRYIQVVFPIKYRYIQNRDLIIIMFSTIIDSI